MDSEVRDDDQDNMESLDQQVECGRWIPDALSLQVHWRPHGRMWHADCPDQK